MSHVTFFYKLFFFISIKLKLKLDKVAELVGGGSVIRGVFSGFFSSLYREYLKRLDKKALFMWGIYLFSNRHYSPFLKVNFLLTLQLFFGAGGDKFINIHCKVVK